MPASSPDPKTLWKAIGPGILVACAAIGGSHLVWSTRAGALFGYQLLGLMLLANLLKFPFFLYGQRYTAATGKSLLQGYRDEGTAYLVVFLLINILTSIINIAGVTMLSAALLSAFGINALPLTQLTAVLLFLGGITVLFGHYRLLDSLAKIVVVFLTVSTVAALALAFLEGPVAPADFSSPSPWNFATIGFLVMFLGWMPAPVDLSAWSSLWMFSRQQQTGHFASVRETSIDFHIGYFLAVVMAVVFLALGATVMHGSGQDFSPKGIEFSRQLIELYSATIGDWSFYLILAAAFITMLSTSLTCLDGYPRALAASTSLLLNQSPDPQRFRNLHLGWILLCTAASIALVLLFVQNLLQLLGFAAIVSFLTSPILAWINFRIMRRETVPPEYRPGLFLSSLSYAGIAFFLLMAAGFLALRLFGL